MRLSRRIAAVAVVALACTALSAPSAGQTPGAGEGDLVVGIVPQRPLEPGEGLEMRRAGIEWTRAWISWADVEATRDEYDWSRPDALIEAASEEGIAVLPMLFGTPGWAAAHDDHRCFGSGCIPFAPASAETRAAFADFAAAAVRRYGPDGGFWSQNHALPSRPIGVWQIWNEQNMDAFFLPEADPGAYAALLSRAAKSIHGEDPDAEVLLGGMFGPRSRAGLVSATRFLRELYRDPRLSGAFDGVAAHPYSGSAIGALEQIRRVRRTIRRHGAGEPLWVTEIGWASSGRADQALVKDRRKQARLVRRTFGRFAAKHEAWNLRGAFWYAWRDTERGRAVCAWCPRAGLVSRSGAEKPAYRVMRRVLAAAR